jgi:DNA-binding transcriptional regulator GbsR (MarR family)
MKDLSPYAEQFILHWGEMSSRWGINRSVAQIHALLYMSDRPLSAEEIAGTLSVARSNVSTSLRELQAWGIVRVVHLMGDRRAYFETMHDAWEMLQVILEQRKRREIDPTIEMLRRCLDGDHKAPREDLPSRKRMKELLELLETLTAWYGQVTRLPRGTQKMILKMGSKLRLLGGKGSEKKGKKKGKDSPRVDHG